MCHVVHRVVVLYVVCCKPYAPRGAVQREFPELYSLMRLAEAAYAKAHGRVAVSLHSLWVIHKCPARSADPGGFKKHKDKFRGCNHDGTLSVAVAFVKYRGSGMGEDDCVVPATLSCARGTQMRASVSGGPRVKNAAAAKKKKARRPETISTASIPGSVSGEEHKHFYEHFPRRLEHGRQTRCFVCSTPGNWHCAKCDKTLCHKQRDGQEEECFIAHHRASGQ